MSTRKAAVPDAWDDDWEAQADAPQPSLIDTVKPSVLTRADRKAQHQENNKQIWEAAEAPPEKPIFLQARDVTPLNAEWKPQLKVLSRKPPSRDVKNAVAGLCLNDEDDSEEEERKKKEAEFADRKARADQERIEKQRRYQEARERIMGTPVMTAEGSSSRDSSGNRSRNSTRTASRGKGGRTAQDDGARSQPASRDAKAGKQLFDPYRAEGIDSQRSAIREVKTAETQKPMRAPKGPDGSGRGGFGFAARGGRSHGPATQGQV